MDQLLADLGALLVWVKWLVICVVATEAVTEIIVDSKLFMPFHARIRRIAYPPDAPPPNTRLRRIAAWVDALTSCGYCLSVWVGGWFALLLPGYPSAASDARTTWLHAILAWLYEIPGVLVFWLAYWFR